MAITMAEYSEHSRIGFYGSVPRVRIRCTPFGRSWMCETRKHRYHRDAERARKCSAEAVPFQQMVSVSGPMTTTLEFDEAGGPP